MAVQLCPSVIIKCKNPRERELTGEREGLKTHSAPSSAPLLRWESGCYDYGKRCFFLFLFMVAGIVGGSLLAYSWLGGMGKISTLLLWKRSHGSSKRYTWMGPTPSLRPWAKIIEIVTSSRSTLDSEHEGLPSICLNWLRWFDTFFLYLFSFE